MESIPVLALVDCSQHHRTRSERPTDFRLLFPRASGLARGKMRRAGVSERAIKTNTGVLSA